MRCWTRRRFVGLVASSLFAPLVGCGDGGVSVNLQDAVRPDLVLTGRDEELASLVQSQFSRLKALAENPGTTLRIGVPIGGRTEVLAFSFRTDGVVNYRHLSVLRESTGEAVNLVWGWKRPLPSVQMVDDAGRLITRNGRPIEVGFADVRGRKRQALDWIAVGVKVAAVAFALWLGAGIGRAILGAIGFLAFNAMVLGLLVAAVGVLSPAIDWLLRNITLGDVERFFQQLVSDIIRLFNEIAQLLASFLA
ncbi:MAG: hypothetical protein LKKZDAJK_001084 [Candidatus Fervidibacter sp.]